MTATIEDLPPEILVEIFSYCIESEGHLAFQTNVVPVCKTWRSLSWAPSLRKEIDVFATGDYAVCVMKWKYALSLSNRGLLHHTKTLIAYGWPSDDPLLPLAVLANIGDLKWLEMIDCDIRTNTMIILPKLFPNLENLVMVNVSFDESQPLTLKELGPILTKCGPKLKLLRILHCETETGEELIAEVAAKCPSLEVFHWLNNVLTEIPMYKLASGCPRLRILDLTYCDFVNAGENDCSGFKELVTFQTTRCGFNGLDVCSLLKNSNNLEFLRLNQSLNLVLSDFSKIPSNKLRFLEIETDYEEQEFIYFVALNQAVDKWKHCLLHLIISGWRRDVTSVLKVLLHNNPCLKLEKLEIRNVDQGFLKIFIENCKTLKELEVGYFPNYYENREQIMQLRDSL